jgi:mycothiol synthase
MLRPYDEPLNTMRPALPVEYGLPALYMLWPRSLLAVSPPVTIPEGYTLRPYSDGDEQRLFPLFASEGWTITAPEWQDYTDRILPDGLFVVWHVANNQPVGTAGAIHNPRAGRYYFPFGGALAYLVVHPDHRGRGLGVGLAALVVQRLRAAGYVNIWVGVQGFRLPAIKTYLRIGFVPFLHQDGLAARWKRICEDIEWPFAPEIWPTTLSVPGTISEGRGRA